MNQRELANAFHNLHKTSEILVLPGVWDAASARVFASQGFGAIGTTSSGMAWSLGNPTGQETPWPVFLDACRRVAQSVKVPVSFDIESGFADSSTGVCEHVHEVIEAGACGINLEDGVADGAFQSPDLVVESLRAICALCKRIDFPLFVNARTDVYLGGIADPSKRLDEAIARGRLYAEAGADGFFVPGVMSPDEIKAIVENVSLPINVYVLPGLAGAEELAGLGVRRVSVGSGPMQAVLARTATMAAALHSDRDWSGFTKEWMAHEDVMRLFS